MCPAERVKAYDSYINSSLADMMMSPGSAQQRSGAKRPSCHKKTASLCAKVPPFVGRRDLAEKLREPSHKSSSIAPEMIVSFQNNLMVVPPPPVNTFDIPKAESNKEPLPPPPGLGSDISLISREEPSSLLFLNNPSLLYPPKDVVVPPVCDDKNEESQSENVDECPLDGEIVPQCANGGRNDTKLLSRRCADSTLCSYNDSALAGNEDRISEYLDKLVRIDNKYKEMFARLREEKHKGMQVIISKCMMSEEENTSRGQTREIMEGYDQTLEEYRKKKQIIKQQQLAENNRLLAQYRQFHSTVLHGVLV